MKVWGGPAACRARETFEQNPPAPESPKRADSRIPSGNSRAPPGNPRAARRAGFATSGNSRAPRGNGFVTRGSSLPPRGNSRVPPLSPPVPRTSSRVARGRLFTLLALPGMAHAPARSPEGCRKLAGGETPGTRPAHAPAPEGRRNRPQPMRASRTPAGVPIDCDECPGVARSRSHPRLISRSPPGCPAATGSSAALAFPNGVWQRGRRAGP